ncbi:MAG: acyltransferase family protein [Spirosomataceae bacterium]
MLKKSDTSIHSIQNLRGIAAISVVLSHLFVNHTSSSDQITRFISSFAELGTLGVEMFFIISGFIIPYSLYKSNYKINDWKTFLTKRVIRIYLPYLASLLLTISFILAWKYLLPNSNNAYIIDSKAIFTNLFFINPFYKIDFVNYSYWTLFVEIQYYLLVAFTYPLIFKFKNVGVLLVGLVLFSLNFILPAGSLPLYSHFLLFTIGTVIFLYYTAQISAFQFLLFCIFLLFTQFLWHFYILHWNRTIPVCIVSILSIFFIVKLNFHNRFIHFLGNISFSLYLIHQPVIVYLNSLMFLKGIQVDRFIYLVFQLLISLLAAWIFYTIIEKPTHSLLKKNFKN